MLVVGVMLLFIGAGVAMYGNQLNNDLSSQFEAVLDGRVNPGDFMLYLGLIIACAGALCIGLLIACKISEAMASRNSETLTERTDTLKNVRWCSSCGAKLSGNDNFCFHCGEKLGQQNVATCEQCKTVLEPSMMFCPKCGKEQKHDNA